MQSRAWILQIDMILSYFTDKVAVQKMIAFKNLYWKLSVDLVI